jgi:Ca-activated chloride channel family protein
MSLHHFSFGAPYYLFALLVVPLLFAYASFVRRRRPRYALSFTNVGALTAAAGRRRPRWWLRAPLVLLALALAAASAALARPRVQLTAADRGATIVLLVDVSASMRANDVGGQRLTAAVTALHNFMRAVPDDTKVGLVSFSDKVRVLRAPTTDHAAVDSSVDILKPQGGTALGEGVVAAVKLIVSSLSDAGVHHTPGERLPAAIVLESDGAQNRGTVSPYDAAKLAQAAGVPIYGVAFGTRNGYITQGHGFFGYRVNVRPDPGIVGLLARQSGGRAFGATTGAEIDKVYKDLGSQIARHPEVTGIAHWFELAAAILLVAGLCAARLRGAALP